MADVTWRWQSQRGSTSRLRAPSTASTRLRAASIYVRVCVARPEGPTTSKRREHGEEGKESRDQQEEERQEEQEGRRDQERLSDRHPQARLRVCGCLSTPTRRSLPLVGVAATSIGMTLRKEGHHGDHGE